MRKVAIVQLIASCMVAAASAVPGTALGQQLDPVSCSGLSSTATTCFTGTITNGWIDAATTGSPGAVAGSWNVYTNANLTNSTGFLTLVGVSSRGGTGVSNNPNGGYGGQVTFQNDGTLSWTGNGNTPTWLVNIQIIGGNGYTATSDGYGGVGGSIDNVLSVTNRGAIQLNGTADGSATALYAYSTAGNGGDGQEHSINYYGGNGGNSSLVSVSNSGAISLGTSASFLRGNTLAVAIDAGSVGGNGGGGSCSNYTSCPNGNGSFAGNGGSAGPVTLSNAAPLAVYWTLASPASSNSLFGIRANSLGGRGADSQNNYSSGGLGGDSGSITVANTQNITLSTTATTGLSGAGIYARTQGGQGGTGNKQDSSNNGVGGSGGTVSGTVPVTFYPSGTTQQASVSVTHGGSGIISTTGNQVAGIVALSHGGNGGSGGSGYQENNSSGGVGGNAGIAVVSVSGTAQILTSGTGGLGVFAQSVGGIGGNGGTDGGLVGQAGGAGIGGSAGGAAVTTVGGTSVRTTGDFAVGIAAQTIGGGGGTGGDFVGVLGQAGGAGQGGRGGDACLNPGSAGCAAVFNTGIQALGSVSTTGQFAYGLLAQSIGGAGGAGGISDTLTYSLGGQGAAGGSGSGVKVESGGTVQTQGYGAHGVLVQSIGGGGGAGGVAVGVLSIGGNGASDYTATGGQVIVTQSGTVQTAGNAAHGILAQSIGGGGGSGAGSTGIIGVGGKGSAGGAGDSVQVTANGTIGTAGRYSSGVIAQSIGGGGGDGGDVLSFGVGVLTIGVGGSASGGGAGGAATIGFGGGVTTVGTHSAGLVAQSIGGGGGNGGDIGGVGLESFFTYTMGGSGGAAANGGAATIQTVAGAASPTIQTAGSYGVGVLAQSIGGGGGNGGNAWGLNASLEFQTTVAVGGAAGGGGNGGNVAVNWQGGSITTGANMRAMSTAPYQAISLTGQAGNAYGLLAQSVGGGGGNGGSASVDQFVASLPSEVAPIPSVSIGISVGGASGGGGTGGTVGVSLSGASIVTWGAGSHALLAQSVGGGGGTGGDASALGVAGAIPDSNEMPTFVIGYAQGTSGGSGGNGQAVNVTVDQRSILTTYGDNANAIVAQSIGGGGGDGGTGNASTFALFEGTSVKPTVGLGGTGANGGTGGNVVVTVGSGAWLNTVGSGSRGVVAQSIGGGGGTSQGGTGGISSGSFTGTLQVGRVGGGGNDSGTVSVTNQGLITTLAKDADGIVAQSIGGGGGLGGTFGADGSLDNPNWINVVWDVQYVIKTLADTGANYAMTATVGGKGGAGGAANAVTIRNTGVIRTVGDWADGIVAQSIGGGGGAGGTAVADGSQQTTTVQAYVGGSGGSGGSGSTITLQDIGLISTQGFRAYGLLAQSIGGGGGQGGDGSGKSTGQITVGGGAGGSGGSSGQGGIVLLDTASDAVVSTKGIYAHGIVLQSIGGGGGVGGSGSSTTPAIFSNNVGYTVSVGGSGGSSGNGCAVTVGGGTANGDNCQVTTSGQGVSLGIQTQGLGAYGLVAQSIGGGGGIGGAANASQNTNVAVGGSGGSGGNGGAVSLALANSRIMTSGLGAHAVVAQSIGGGGGIGGDPSGTTMSFSAPGGSSIGGGNFGTGNGGTVSVVTGSGSRIMTAGDYAFGIIAQSIGGGGGLSGSTAGVFAGSNGGPNSTSGAVSVAVGGAVVTSGNNAIGIFAQSAASDGAGAVTVNIGGSVSGGSGTQGAGVHIDGGNAGNAVTVSSSGSLSALSGNAVTYSGNFAPTVTNAGTSQGNFLLRPNLGALGQLTNSGTLIAGNLLDANVSNSGRLSMFHPTSAFATTVITGNYSQSSTGTTIIGGDLTAGTSDRLQITGSAVLDGRVSFNFRTMRPNQSVTVLTADGGITGRLTADNGPGLFSYQLQQTGNAVSVSVAGANLASPSFGLNASQTAVANGLQNIWNAGGGTFDGLFAALQSAAASGSYGDALSKLSPGVALAPAARSRDNVQEFSNNLMSCPVFETDSALVGETQCSWARVGGRLTNQSTSGGIAGFNNWLMNYQVGAQVEIAPDWFLGGSLAYQQSWLSGTDGRVSSNGTGGSVGVVLKRELGPWLFAGSLGGSMNWYDTRRTIAIPGLAPTVAYGNSTVLSGQARLRAAYSLAFQDWYVRPYADVDLIHVSVPGYSETGAGALGLTYDTASQWNVAFSPTMEVGGRINLQGGHTFRPYASAGLTAFTNSNWTSTARLQGGLGAGSFTSTLATDPVVARFSAGFQLMTKDSFDFRLTYDGAFSEHTVSNALSLKAAMRF
jgi:uncharacterized protein YhjY with autotransporter beta-barrel domain